ncbi:MAG: hypothetical protein AAFR52_07235 [Pseudomonadota bacterium]
MGTIACALAAGLAVTVCCVGGHGTAQTADTDVPVRAAPAVDLEEVVWGATTGDAEAVAALEAETAAYFESCMDQMRRDVPFSRLAGCFNVYDMMMMRLRRMRGDDRPPPRITR